jgi:gentisate 1,2-dioxygenase
VVEGEGWFRERDGERTPVRAGEAIFWSEGEWHETGTDRGLVVIVIESTHLVEVGSLGPVVKPTS